MKLTPFQTFTDRQAIHFINKKSDFIINGYSRELPTAEVIRKMILIYTFSGQIFKNIISCFIVASQHHLQSKPPNSSQLKLQYGYLNLLFKSLKRNKAAWDKQTIDCFDSCFEVSLMKTLKYLTFH